MDQETELLRLESFIHSSENDNYFKFRYWGKVGWEPTHKIREDAEIQAYDQEQLSGKNGLNNYWKKPKK